MAAVAVSPSSNTDPDQLRDVSRAIALARTGDGGWLDVFTVMQEFVGWEVAGRWLVIELEIAGVIPPEAERQNRGAERHGPQL